MVDWALFHTRLCDPEVRAIVEYCLIVMKVRREVSQRAGKEEEKKDN